MTQNHNQFITNEDPLEADVDRFVGPDETRFDEQLAYDERVANALHMSGALDSDDYWDEYDELYGDQSDATDDLDTDLETSSDLDVS